MFNNADGCYDHIRHNIMAIALQKQGCDKTVIEMVMGVLLAIHQWASQKISSPGQKNCA